MFPVISVPANTAESIEQLGTKEKFWFTDPQRGRCLCKIIRPGTGEDWSEKVAAELAQALGLPHAAYDLGSYQGKPCVVSPTFVPKGGTLLHGNELLGQSNPSYVANFANFKQSSHTVHAVMQVLDPSACQLPLGWRPPQGIVHATDVFLGYLLLDAWIGNTDRHHENWGLVKLGEHAEPSLHLAPAFDHASCLGCHETDTGKHARLRTFDRGFNVAAYAQRARSAFYLHPTDKRPLPTLDAFELATTRLGHAASVWLNRLEAIASTELDILLNKLPPERITETSAAFAKAILLLNRQRLLALRGGD